MSKQDVIEEKYRWIPYVMEPKRIFIWYRYVTDKHMSHFSYACKTEGENGISRLISEME